MAKLIEVAASICLSGDAVAADNAAVFDFLMKQGPVEIKEAYATFNMGAGFAGMWTRPMHSDAWRWRGKQGMKRGWVGRTARGGSQGGGDFAAGDYV